MTGPEYTIFSSNKKEDKLRAKALILKTSRPLSLNYESIYIINTDDASYIRSKYPGSTKTPRDTANTSWLSTAAKPEVLAENSSDLQAFMA